MFAIETIKRYDVAYAMISFGSQVLRFLFAAYEFEAQLVHLIIEHETTSSSP